VIRFRIVTLVLAIVVVSGGVLFHGATAAERAPLSILLTNDDGIDAPGIKAMREALEGAGYNVLVVAPANNQSGKSGSITVHGPLKVEQLEPNVFSVAGTPSDCVRIGLALIASDPPDLVVSGINFGQNVGPGVMMSGTVGAALAARALGYPAIAVSQMFDMDQPEETLAFFPYSAAALVDLIERVGKGKGEFPADMLLNVNYPLRAPNDLTSWEITYPSSSTRIIFGYEWTEDQSGVDVSLTPPEDPSFEDGSDEAALDHGAMSISPLNWLLGQNDGLTETVKDRIGQ